MPRTKKGDLYLIEGGKERNPTSREKELKKEGT
jgi:hypothetical protein